MNVLKYLDFIEPSLSVKYPISPQAMYVNNGIKTNKQTYEWENMHCCVKTPTTMSSYFINNLVYRCGI